MNIFVSCNLLLHTLLIFYYHICLSRKGKNCAFEKETKTKCKELWSDTGHSDDKNITVDWRLAFNIPPRSLTSSPHITVLHAGSVGGQKGLGWALLVSLTFVLPSQLVHQVGLACAVEAHDSHHHNRLPDGRQDLQGFWINQQSPINVLNEALWAWHVDLWGHVPLSAREDMGWFRISSLIRSRTFMRLFCIQKEECQNPHNITVCLVKTVNISKEKDDPSASGDFLANHKKPWPFMSTVRYMRLNLFPFENWRSVIKVAH